jgi:AcrR family transcriptional regulator
LLDDTEVLDRALAVLVERGPQFTLPEVGRAVGLSASTLIQRFGSKRAMLDRVLERATVRLEDAVRRMPDSNDPRRDLTTWLVELSRVHDTRERVAANLALLIEDLVDAERHALAERHMRLIRSGMDKKLRALGSRTPKRHVDLLEAQWHGLVIQWALHGSGGLEAWMRGGLLHLLDVLVPPGTTSPRFRRTRS